MRRNWQSLGGCRRSENCRSLKGNWNWRPFFYVKTIFQWTKTLAWQWCEAAHTGQRYAIRLGFSDENCKQLSYFQSLCHPYPSSGFRKSDPDITLNSRRSIRVLSKTDHWILYCFVNSVQKRVLNMQPFSVVVKPDGFPVELYVSKRPFELRHVCLLFLKNATSLSSPMKEEPGFPEVHTRYTCIYHCCTVHFDKTKILITNKCTTLLHI
jgi:hypothetical protein